MFAAIIMGWFFFFAVDCLCANGGESAAGFHADTRQLPKSHLNARMNLIMRQIFYFWRCEPHIVFVRAISEV